MKKLGFKAWKIKKFKKYIKRNNKSYEIKDVFNSKRKAKEKGKRLREKGKISSYRTVEKDMNTALYVR